MSISSGIILLIGRLEIIWRKAIFDQHEGGVNYKETINFPTKHYLAIDSDSDYVQDVELASFTLLVLLLPC